ncbi:hypothetical protein HKD37_11G032190 [Glycine soja]
MLRLAPPSRLARCATLMLMLCQILLCAKRAKAALSDPVLMMDESPQEKVQMVEMAEGSELECSPPLLLLVMMLVLWAPQSQAPGLWRPHPFQRKKAGLLARPPVRQTPLCS